MKLFRTLVKTPLAILLAACALLLPALISSRIEQHVFRKQAELLLSQLQSLELRKTSWQEAQTQLTRWGANRHFGKCDQHECSVQIVLTESVFGFLISQNIFVKLDDYFRWRLKLSYDEGPFVRMEQEMLDAYLRTGGHPARIIANIDMRDGTVWSKGFSLRIETYGHPIYWSGNCQLEFGLFADARTVPEFPCDPCDLFYPQLAIHPTYRIGRPGGCTICVKGWTEFTPYADPADVKRLMQLNLSCLTQWRPCTTQAEIMPAAWSQYLAELPPSLHPQ